MIDILSKDFEEKLNSIGYKNIGQYWFSNKDDTIRIRLWKNNEATFWYWHSEDSEYNEIRFIGQLKTFYDVIWILGRCFNKKNING